ncbi:MAG TPA: hypothetical protein VHV78_15960, partial [Gemmatimonadaceae bacterium]|nr:hypothetical protein [Gemmatimonadaceae bacterium]
GGVRSGGRTSYATPVTRLGLALTSVVVGLLIGAVQFAPLLFEYMPWSPRAGGHSVAEASSYSYPIEETLNWYLPQFSGILDNYWGRNGIHFHSDYFGVLVLVLAGAAFGQTEQKAMRRFWVGVGIVSLLWAFGGNTPFFQLVLLVPGTKFFRAPSVIIFVTAFAVAVLAAMGAERILARRVGTRYAVGWLVAGGVIALLMSAGGYSALVNGVASSIANGYPPEAHSQIVGQIADRAASNAGAAILGAWRSFFFVVLGAGAIWAFATNRLSAKRTMIVLAVLMAVDLWSIERLYWIFSPRASIIFASDPAIDAIKRAEARPNGLGRVWTLRAGAGLADRDAAFYDALWSHDLRLVAGYHGNEMYMYQQLIGADSGRVIVTPQFWRHENVRYIYTGVDVASMASLDSSLKLGAGHITRIAGPVRDAAGSMVYAYEIPGDNSAAWVATAMVKAPEAQAFATVLDPRFDPSRVAIIDSAATTVQTSALQSLPEAAPQHATVTASPAGAYDITLDQPSTAGQALLVSDNYFPTWRATANGSPAVVARADFNLIGVVLPAGTRTVQLRFTDPAFEKGKVVTLAAAALALLALAMGLALGRPRAATVTVVPVS